MKIMLTHTTPRNPLVAAAHLRQAGRHQPFGNASRQAAGRALRRELQQLTHHKHSP